MRSYVHEVLAALAFSQAGLADGEVPVGQNNNAEVWNLEDGAELPATATDPSVDGPLQCPRDLDLEMYIMIDATASFAGYHTQVKNLLPNFIKQVGSQFKSHRFGLGLFGDRPRLEKGGQYSDDECFVALSGLTDSEVDYVQAVSGIKKLNGSGGDYPENPLEALVYVSGSAGFTTASSDLSSIHRVVVIITDDEAKYLEMTGAASSGSYPNPNLASGIDCNGGEDYAPLLQIEESIRQNKIIPLVVKKGSTTKWEELLRDKLHLNEAEAGILPWSIEASTIATEYWNAMWDADCFNSTTTSSPASATTTDGKVNSTEKPPSDSSTTGTTKTPSSGGGGTGTSQGPNIPVIVGAAAGAAVAAAVAGVFVYKRFVKDDDPQLDVGFEEGAGSEEEIGADRDMDNPTTSEDYGEYRV